MTNPIVKGWYADPEARFYEGKYYIYVTRSTNIEDCDKQMNIDAFSSEDLKTWKKHEGVIQMEGFPWVKKAVWAPTIIEKNNKYYLIFASNDIRRDYEGGGLEIAVSDSPKGPFKAFLDKPLIDNFINGAQPIDAHLFKDDDGTIYLYYGGWGHCNVGIFNEEMNGFVKLDNGQYFKEITPKDYVEGPCMLKKDGKYYFMWSQGSWMNDTYCVAYGLMDSPIDKVNIEGVVLKTQENIAKGPGHHGYLKINDKEEWKIVYHRRPMDSFDGGDRVLCIDDLKINDKIEEVIMT